MYVYQFYICAALENLIVMKNVLVLGALAFIGLSSCKKDWTCTCTTTTYGETVSESSIIENATWHEAEEECFEGSYMNSISTRSCFI